MRLHNGLHKLFGVRIRSSTRFARDFLFTKTHANQTESRTRFFTDSILSLPTTHRKPVCASDPTLDASPRALHPANLKYRRNGHSINLPRNHEQVLPSYPSTMATPGRQIPSQAPVAGGHFPTLQPLSKAFRLLIFPFACGSRTQRNRPKATPCQAKPVTRLAAGRAACFPAATLLAFLRQKWLFFSTS